MALDQRDVEIQSPCPIDLDAARMRGNGRSWHCGHCDKTVHVLSKMTEPEARSFLAAHAGQDLCVSYTMSSSGEVRFRPEPIVPVASLVRRPARVAAVGIGLALAACAPHDNPKLTPQPISYMETVTTEIERPRIPPSVPPIVQPHVEDIQVDGGMRMPEVQVDGGMRAPELVEPPPRVTKRGMMKRIVR